MASIYITYNPGKKYEEAAVYRMQTMANIHGINVYLPDRLGQTANSDLKENTKQRIDASLFFIAFSLNKPSKQFLKELNYAADRNKIIIVIYGFQEGKNLVHENKSGNIIEKHIDFSKGIPTKEIDEMLSQIKSVLQNWMKQKLQGDEKIVPKKTEEKKEAENALWAVGLGLFFLYMLNKE